MGKLTGFMDYARELPAKADRQLRIKNSKEFILDFPAEKTKQQAARCMDCGVPFCHWGCPLGNRIPAFNNAVYREQWDEAIRLLHATNNFPEFTGRICPAPCEASCVLGINKDPVTIELLEKTIAETAFEKGLIKAMPPAKRTSRKVAVIGSGPAGLAAAAQLNSAGHRVSVYERNDRIGGLLRYGIPDFKLEKHILDRRLALLEEEGIRFIVNANVGVNISVESLRKTYDVLVLCGGATVARDLPIPGRELKGIHYAMDFLTQQNKRIAGDTIETEGISAKDKHVVVIGGGDTGSDCIGTSNRQGAKSVLQIELMEKPPVNRTAEHPWPQWPFTLKTSTSHEEGCTREWSILIKAFVPNKKGILSAIKIVKLQWENKNGAWHFTEIKGSEQIIPCDMALLAIGFVKPEKKGMLEQLQLELDQKGNVKTNGYQTSIDHVFAAGDMRRGQSLVVWAINEGREVASAVDHYLSKI